MRKTKEECRETQEYRKFAPPTAKEKADTPWHLYASATTHPQPANADKPNHSLNSRTMKNLFSVSLALAALCCTTLSCKQEQGLSFDKQTWQDSTEYAFVNVTLELPEANSPAQTAIRQHLIGVMQNQTNEICDSSALKEAEATATCAEIAAYYGKYIATEFDKGSREMNAFRKENVPDVAATPIIPYSAEVSLTKEYEGAKYVVFHSTASIYQGGAHPFETGAGHLTFALEDGKLLTQVLDSARIVDLQPLLREGLTGYFAESTGEDNLNLETMLQIEGELIPLPANQPYLTPKGVAIEYKQYEIACYAAGMPSFVIPYDKARPFMTPEAKALLDEQ